MYSAVNVWLELYGPYQTYEILPPLTLPRESAGGMHQVLLPCIAQPAGTMSTKPIALKSLSGAVKVMVTSKVWPGCCAAAGKSLIACAGPGVIVGVGLAVGVGVTTGVGVGVTSGVGVGVTSGVGVGVTSGVGVGVGVGITLSIYRSTHVNPPSANKTVA